MCRLLIPAFSGVPLKALNAMATEWSKYSQHFQAHVSKPSAMSQPDNVINPPHPQIESTGVHQGYSMPEAATCHPIWQWPTFPGNWSQIILCLV